MKKLEAGRDGGGPEKIDGIGITDEFLDPFVQDFLSTPLIGERTFRTLTVFALECSSELLGDLRLDLFELRYVPGQ